MNNLLTAIENGNLLLDISGNNISEIFEHVVDHMVEAGSIPAATRGTVLSELLGQEHVANSAVGNSVAIPHVYIDKLDKSLVYFVRLAHPLNLGAADGIATRFMFFLLGPEKGGSEHLNTLARVASLMADEEFRYQLGKCKSKQGFLLAIEQFDSRHPTQIPSEAPSEPSNEGLEFTRRFCGGLRDDIARRLPYYWSDFTDGFDLKCVGSTLFLFFACLAPAVLFGGLMADVTGNQIGVVEMILASAVCGVIYALCSGQPLIILGGTGPLLVFTAILYVQCERLEIEFLSTYAWVGIWSSILLLLITMFDGSFLMRYFTRFTDEIFAALISIIFIVEAVKSVVNIFHDPETTTLAEPFLAIILAWGTYSVAMYLSRLRKSDYLRPQLRQILADFGPAIALIVMSLIAVSLKDDVPTQDFLSAPATFGTTSGRAWLVDLWSAPMWVRFMSIIPAILVTVLVYLDQNITARLVNSPDHHLQKGVAYHLDLGIVAILMAGCSFFGLPWLVAATVRSLNHVRSLATVEEEVDINGHSHERVIHVRENRLTGVLIHLAIGLILFLMLDMLHLVPKSTLYGLFLFMGIVSMTGNQFFARTSLWIRDPSFYPSTHYIRRVPNKVIHIFTAFQLLCLTILWVVKVSALGILFPLFIALLVPLRALAGRFIKDEYLHALDSDEGPEEESSHYSV
jgi:mannitol/fructose-specific phosphotransferase system IIA component (Ntr-type)